MYNPQKIMVVAPQKLSRQVKKKKKNTRTYIYFQGLVNSD